MDKGIVYKFFPNLVNGKYYIKQRTIKNGVKKHSNMPNLVFDNKKDAKTKCEELEKSWNRFDVTGGERNESLRLKDLIKIYLNEVKDKYSLGDIKQKRSTYRNHVIPIIGDVQIGMITRRDILLYRDHISSFGNSSATVYHRYGNLSALFTWAIKKGYMEYNPCSLVEWPIRNKTDNSHLENWGSKNLMQLMVWIDNHHPRDRALFEIMAKGVERGVLAGIRIMDFREDDSALILQQNILDIVRREPKWGIVKGRIREVALDVDEFAILSQHVLAQGRFLKDNYGIVQTKESPLFNRYYLARQETDLMKVGEEIQWLDPDWITVTSKRNTAGAGLPPVKPHEFRKVLRTIHRELDISPDDTAEILGNTAKTVMDYYTPKSSEQLKRNVDKVMEQKRKALAQDNVVPIRKEGSTNS